MRELVLSCTEDQADAWSDALLGAGALSVAIEDAHACTPDEQALFGEPGTEPEVQAWRRSRLCVLLADGVDPAQVLAALEGLPGWRAGQQADAVREVSDADWVRLTQAQFEPILVAERVWIVPSWHREDAGLPPHGRHTDGIRIELDPGLAFGTGNHPTTRLCLEWLADHLPSGACVLDYGCGSGILAIAAVLLGAGPVVAVDIDPQAVESARRNALDNQVELRVCLPDDMPAGTHQVVVANILSGPLKLLAPMLCARVRCGGHLVLSGVLERQATEVIQAYASWLPLEVVGVLDGWVCLAGQRGRMA